MAAHLLAKGRLSTLLTRSKVVCSQIPILSRHLHATIVGCYEDFDSDRNDLCLTSSGDDVDRVLGGRIKDNLKMTNFKPKPGKVRVFHGLDEAYPCVVVAGLGKRDAHDDGEEIDQEQENVRVAVSAGYRSAKEANAEMMMVDPCSHPSAASEGVHLQAYAYERFKTKKTKPIQLQLLDSSTDDDRMRWEQGFQLSEGQNLARELMETPSNYKYPELLAAMIEEKLRFDDGNTTITVRDKAWIEEQGMGGVLGVSQGSMHEPRFLEIDYKGSECDQPVALVGKGVTFDSGGISIKPSQSMGIMRGDMGGAACVVGAMLAAAKLHLPVRVVALIPLCENMPSGSAIRPGDVLTAMNKKTIEVDNTDAEGRLILADALCYAHQFNPSNIIDVATLTGAIDVALGAGATGFYTTSDALWSRFHEAGKVSGDRMWRMPLFEYYSKQMDCSVFADIRNTQKKARSAGSCTAAAFLKEFVEIKNWAHLDIAGVMTNEGDQSYLGKGMSGRPTRTIVEALKTFSSNN